MSCVSAMIIVCLDAPRGRVPLLARFSYDNEDPYVVRAEFFDGPTILARWDFDRQMLADGLHRPVGEGDVTFGPHRSAATDELRVTLRGRGAEGGGDAVLFLEARTLAAFLERSYAVTGAGEESLDLDKLLADFLAR